MKRRIFALLLATAMLLSSAGAITVEEARQIVEQLYIDEVPGEILLRETVEEIFEGLDKYSIYYSPEEYAAFLDTVNDVTVVGIGVVCALTEDATGLEIRQVIAGGAAEAGGIRDGDVILAVDGRLVYGASGLEQVTGWIQGEEGSTVYITLRRTNGVIEEMTLVRKAFYIPYTEYGLIDGHIGYIDCDSFGNETYGHFLSAMEEYDEQVNCWVVDLRGNGGGLTGAAAETAGIFTGRGNQVLLRDRAGDYYGFDASGEVVTMAPVILLVDEGSASSSELLAAAVRDAGVGPVIGTRTYGKGVAQTLLDQSVEPEMFADGSALRITYARFYSPGGAVNDKVGVLPNLLVDGEYTDDVALLLSGVLPSEEENDGLLRIHTGGWRLYVDVSRALEEEGGALRSAFAELLEAIWPQSLIYWGHGNGTWEMLYANEVAERCGLEDYEARWFSDVDMEENEIGYAMNVLKTYGILRGDENGRANPGSSMTRGELCAMLSQALNYAKEEETPHFSDLPADAWYTPAVNAMAEMGFVRGDENGLFHPERVLTCEELLVVMERVGAWMGINLYETRKIGPAEGALEDESLSRYSDWAVESAWLLGRAHQNRLGRYICYVWEDVGGIEPGASVTRGEAAYSLYRMMDLVGLLEE